MAQRPPTHSELQDLESRAVAAPSGSWRRQEGGGLDHFNLRLGQGESDVHLYAPPAVGEAVTRLLEAARADLPRLVAEVRRLREEVDALQGERDARPAVKAAPRATEGAPRVATGPARVTAASMEIDEDAALGLAAPFHVGPKEMKAAQSDPLAALSVQVARALLPDAKEVERARLIAMAFAATRGQMEDFWAARKMRAAGKKAGAKKK